MHDSHADSDQSVYSLQAQIEGHEGIVLCIAATEDGKLASGGYDGTRVWDLRKLLHREIKKKWVVPQLTRPSGAGDRGPTTALSWIRREDEPDDGIIFGTARGLVVCWKEVFSGGISGYEESYCAQLTNPSEITAICFDTTSNRVVVSNRSSVVQLFRLGAKFDLHPIFSVIIKDHIPKAITFVQQGDDSAICTFGLHDGQIHTLSGKDGKVVSTRQTGCKIGNVASNIKRGVFCIDDPNEGVALYRFDSWERVRVYPVLAKKVAMRPRQVSFLDNCKYILSTSDHGCVYIYNRRSGVTVDCLKNGKSNKVQALGVMDHSERPVIFAAMYRGDGEGCTIDIWQKNVVVRQAPIVETKPKEASVKRRPAMLNEMIQTLIFLCIVAMAGAFLWQNKHYVGY